MAVLDEPGVLRAGGQDRDGGLEGVAGESLAGVDLGDGTDELAIEDGAGQVVEPGGQVAHVGLVLGETVGDLGDRAAGDPDAVRLDVQQGPDAVLLFLDAPGILVLLDGLRLPGIQVVPGAEEHGLDLRRQRLPGVLLPPVVVA